MMCEVAIEQGRLRGAKVKNVFGDDYFSFQGIPYAKPPIGHLRFKPPQVPEKFNGIFDATQEGSPCISRNVHKKYIISGSENCLVLNVFTKQFSQKLPVLFWIHGGAFIWGSSTTEEYAPDFLLSEDVVVVSINYRLGLLGFLNLEDDSLVPRNLGIGDMIMALKWVQSNIDKFGGDSGNVTIFGQSAGAASVHLLVLSPTAKGLFHKAIAQSGCALNPWVYGRINSKDVAKAARLGDISEENLVDYLKSLSIENIFKIQEQVYDALTPCDLRGFGYVDNNSNPVLLTECLKTGSFNEVPLMIGFTTLEGLCFEYFKFPHAKDDDYFQQQIPWFFGYKYGSEESIRVGKTIKEFYYGTEEPSKINKIKKYEIGTDILSIFGIHQSAVLQAATSKAPIYMYQVSIESELNFLKKLIGATVPGVCHCDELGYLFKTFSTPNIEKNSLEEIGMKRFVKLWTNFAKCGNPTPEITTLLNVKWKPVRANEVFYLDIGKELSLKINPQSDKIEFWKNLYSESPCGKDQVLKQ